MYITSFLIIIVSNTIVSLLRFPYNQWQPMLCFFTFVLFSSSFCFHVFSVLRMAYVIPPSAPSPAVTMRVFLSLHVVSPAYTLWGNNIASQSDLTNCIGLWLVKNFHWINNQVTATLLNILPCEQQVLLFFLLFFFPSSCLQCCDWEATVYRKVSMHVVLNYMVCQWSPFYLSI